MTKTEWKLLEDLYEALDKVVETFHISYDCDSETYHSDFEADDELIASIENAHVDLKYFLGR